MRGKALLVLCAAVLPFVARTPASAAGSWNGSQFRNGVVCASGVPLVSWDLGSGHVPAFFTTGLTQGTPPVDGTAHPVDNPVVAALIARWGDDPSPDRVAQVAELVTEALGTPGDPTCAGGGQDLLARARREAGPYHVALSATSTPAVLGRPFSVAATVTSAAGFPVPDVAVTFPDSVGRTDATGTATGSITATSGTSVSFDVGVNSPTLQEVDATGADPAVLATLAPMSTSLTVPIDTTARPSVQTTSSVGLSLPNVPVRVGTLVSGLNGHAGSQVLVIAGPRPLQNVGDCAKITDAQWQDDVRAARVAVTTVTGGLGDSSFTPPQPGCYAASATVTAVGAQPSADARSPFVPAVAVLPATLTLSGQRLSGIGPLAVTAAVAGADGADVTLSGTVQGPVAPGPTGCGSVSWAGAPSSGSVVAFSSGVRTAAVSRPGCYRIGVQAGLAAGDLGSTSVTSSATVLVLAPSVSFAEHTAWTTIGAAAEGTVTVGGTFGQPATVRTALLWTPATALGCANARWTSATVLATSASRPITGDSAVDVDSPSAPRSGCYSIVPTVTLSADAAVAASGTVGAPLSVVMAGDDTVLRPIGLPRGPAADHTVGTVLAGVAYVLALLASIGVVLGMSRRGRDMSA